MTGRQYNAMPKPGRISGAAFVAGGLAVAQLTAYALNVVAARRLGPDSYGLLVSLLALILVANTAGVGVQTASARRLAAGDPRFRMKAGRSILRLGWITGVSMGVIMFALTPALAALLHISDFLPLVLVALAVVPMIAVGGQLGLAQGHEDFGRVGAIYAVANGCRSLGGIFGALIATTVSGTTLGFVFGAVVGAGLGHLVVRRLYGSRSQEINARISVPGLAIEAAQTAHALFALFIFTNVDILLARHFLPAGDAGEYAIGVVVAKVAFFLPQVIAVIVFPRIARGRSRRALSIAIMITVTLGLILVAAVAVLPHLVVSAAGGSAYAGIASHLWLFAAIGCAYAVIQLALYGRFAVEDRSVVVAIWGAVVFLVGAVWIGPHDSVTVIAVTVLIVATVFAVVATITSLRRLDGLDPQPVDAATSAGSGHGPGA